MHKIVKIALIVVGLIGAILWFMLPDSKMPAPEAAQSGAMGAMFGLTYLLFAIAIIASLGFTLIHMFSNPQGLKKTLFAVGGFAIVAVIAYVLASGSDVSVSEMASKGLTTTEGTIKTIGMGLNLFFILTVVAIGLMLVPGIKKMFGK